MWNTWNRIDVRKLWWGNLKERGHFEDLGMYERVILKWIHLSQVTEKYRALVNTVTKLRVSQNAGNFLTGLGTVSFSRRTVLCGSSSFFRSITDK